MIIIHGGHQVDAQNKLSQLLETAKGKALEVEKIEAKNLTVARLSQSLTPSSLFSGSRLVIISGLLSLPQSNNKKKLLEILKKTKNTNLILFEEKAIHPATIKSLPTSEVHLFKESPLIYKFIDSLNPASPKQALSVLEEIIKSRQPLEFLFFMLARHVRQLIQIKTPGSLKLAPWQLGKLSKQSSLFSTDKLIDLHHRLYDIDKRQKTSQVKSLETELKQLILNL